MQKRHYRTLRQQEIPNYKGFRDFDRKPFTLPFGSYFAQDVSVHTSLGVAGYGCLSRTSFSRKNHTHHEQKGKKQLIHICKTPDYRSKTLT